MQKNYNNISRTKGFTLTELIVTISVLLIVLMGFARILKSTREATTTAQQYMAMDASSSAIDALIRRDVSEYSSLGGIELKDNQIAIFTAGPAVSIRNTNTKGIGSIIVYGFAPINPGTRAEQIQKYKNLQSLYRMKIVLTSNGGAASVADAYSMALSKIQFGNTDETSTIAQSKVDANVKGKPIKIFIQSLADLNGNGWVSLTHKVAKKGFSTILKDFHSPRIQMKYYDKNGNLSAWTSTFSSKDPANKDRTPALIKFSYALADTTLPKADQARFYEVIVQLN